MSLIGFLERDWPDQAAEAFPSADAVVVLGGAFSSGNGRYVYPNASGLVDRYWHAARIYLTGRAPIVIVSGGRSPHLTAGRTEAEMWSLFLQDLGVPSDAIILDKLSLSARNHAIYLQQIVGDQGFESLMVVTSAWHMRRSIGSKTSNLAELPHNTNTGAVFPSDQTNEMVKFVSSLQQNPAQHKQYCKNALVLAEEFTSANAFRIRQLHEEANHD